jgi:hypothetical protein
LDDKKRGTEKVKGFFFPTIIPQDALSFPPKKTKRKDDGSESSFGSGIHIFGGSTRKDSP